MLIVIKLVHVGIYLCDYISTSASAFIWTLHPTSRFIYRKSLHECKDPLPLSTSVNFCLREREREREREKERERGRERKREREHTLMINWLRELSSLCNNMCKEM